MPPSAIFIGNVGKIEPQELCRSSIPHRMINNVLRDIATNAIISKRSFLRVIFGWLALQVSCFTDRLLFINNFCRPDMVIADFKITVNQNHSGPRQTTIQPPQTTPTIASSSCTLYRHIPI